jgi:prevent-host-death family protein
MKSASIEEARRTLGDLVDRARLVGEPTLITRHGRPAAVVVGADWYEARVGTDDYGNAQPSPVIQADGPVTAPAAERTP